MEKEGLKKAGNEIGRDGKREVLERAMHARYFALIDIDSRSLITSILVKV